MTNQKARQEFYDCLKYGKDEYLTEHGWRDFIADDEEQELWEELKGTNE